MKTWTSLCLFLVLLFAFVGKSSQKTCRQAQDLTECFSNRTGFIECDYNSKSRRYELTAEVLCTAGTECSCMIGDGCSAEEMCQKINKRLDFVDVGVLKWSGTKYHEEDAGYETWVIKGDLEGFSYKSPSGRMYREVMDSHNWRGNNDWQYFLYIPVAANAKKFKRIHKASNGRCTKSIVNLPMSLVPKGLSGATMLKKDGNSQHWQWRYDIGVDWKKWDFHVKQFRGKFVPQSFNYQEQLDGMGLGSWANEKLQFTYYPQPTEPLIATISMKEKNLLESCGMA